MGTPLDAKSLVWCVQPTAGYFDGIRVHRLTLNFGIVPGGYARIVPAGGIVPKLPSKVVYYFLAEATNAPNAAGSFYLNEDTPTETTVPGPCESGTVGDLRPLKCGTPGPYIEPPDLDRFVRESRVTK